MKKGGIPALTNQEQVLPTTYVRLGQLESTGLPTGSLARGGGGGTWVFFEWLCAARDSKLAPRSKKNFPLN